MLPMPIILLLAACLLSFSASAQIGAKAQQSNTLYGTWQNQQFGYQMTLILKADGTGAFDGEAIQFTAAGNRLTVTQAGMRTEYQYQLSASSLTLSGGDIDGTITFTRAGTSGASPQAVSEAATSANLVGTWSGYGETVEFTNDGRCNYQGQVFAYTASASQITLTTSQGSVVMPYLLAGDQLKLTVNGQSFTYQRGLQQQKAAPTGVAVAQELVGKWCYVNVTSTNSGGSSSDECITLHPNGTFDYYSERSMSANSPSAWSGTSSQNADQGTWWIEDERIHYRSQKQGQGSYQLQKVNHPKTGEPMIVLDGTAYVTFYQKPAWR